MQKAIGALTALAQETRLRAFRLLVQAGPDGVPAGVLSAELGTPHNTMSFHLAQLGNAGLVQSRRSGRSIIYAANFPFVRETILFMVENCCNADTARVRNDRGRRREIVEFIGCCTPRETRK